MEKSTKTEILNKLNEIQNIYTVYNKTITSKEWEEFKWNVDHKP